jgi:hypothetical protein
MLTTNLRRVASNRLNRLNSVTRHDAFATLACVARVVHPAFTSERAAADVSPLAGQVQSTYAPVGRILGRERPLP